MSTTKSSVRVTIECVDSCEILIVPPTSRRRRHDQEDEATMTTSEINAKRARILQWNQEVLAAARQVSIDESSSRTAESHRVGKLFKFIRTPARQAIRALRRDAYNEYSCRSSHFYACARKQELNTDGLKFAEFRQMLIQALLVLAYTSNHVDRNVSFDRHTANTGNQNDVGFSEPSCSDIKFFK
ncbi:unnamed protein product [Trichogramma brassicae]|uniref:Uncharacterized protein n=1 Tax=Trichogramma brassicae TaxID=86971 RepID=A0A6H5J6R6_9HYME|nr:unnamed protein product [Trichogramma brassicae]